jgi:hypothetical protein
MRLVLAPARNLDTSRVAFTNQDLAHSIDAAGERGHFSPVEWGRLKIWSSAP